MSLAKSVAEILRDRVTLEVESIDRMYLNVYVPSLQTDFGAASFFRYHRQRPFASGVLMSAMTRAFVASIEAFVRRQDVPLITFNKGERKDDVTARYLAQFQDHEGVLYVGKAQEKATVFRTESRYHPGTGQSYPWLVRSTAMVNNFYFYCVDQDFGPFFLKFCSYFPYNAKLCLNGHEYVKRQLAQRAISFEALDNGFLSCAEPQRLQQIADGLSAEKIDALLRKWLRRLPHPFTRRDREAGFRYDISILQAEFSLTQVLDSPLTGRVFFEEVIRENLDVGRADYVQLIFDRRINKTTPGRFRTRVITYGVIPSLHLDYKHSHIKQYHKQGRALRTETTINDTRDFRIGRRLKNLPLLRDIAFPANRRLLDVQRVSHDCAIGEQAFDRITQPGIIQGQRVSGLHLDDHTALAALNAVILVKLLPHGFTHKDLRQRFAQLLGLDPNQVSRGRMTYQLRRLRLHQIIRRIPKTHRYTVTTSGLKAALFFTRLYARLIRPGLSAIMVARSAPDFPKLGTLDHLEAAFNQLIQEAKLAC